MFFLALVCTCAGIIVTLKVHPLGCLILVAAGWLFGAIIHSKTKHGHRMADGSITWIEL